MFLSNLHHYLQNSFSIAFLHPIKKLLRDTRKSWLAKVKKFRRHCYGGQTSVQLSVEVLQIGMSGTLFDGASIKGLNQLDTQRCKGTEDVHEVRKIHQLFHSTSYTWWIFVDLHPGKISDVHSCGEVQLLPWIDIQSGYP